MGSFYGNIKAGSKVSLVFDKTYPNRAAMEDAINVEKNSASGQINGDGVYNTRYVFVDYGERHYSPYISAEVQEIWHQENKFTDKCPPLYVYKIGNSIQTITNINYSSSYRQLGAYQLVDLENDNYNATYRYYILRNDIVIDEQHNLTPDGIDENCEYAINKEIDKARYQDNYDHTVWQKIWCSVSDTSTITEKYIMVASLDAKAPKFNSITDAPDDNDEYELATFVYEDGSPVKLSPLNVYYYIADNIIIGEGDEIDTIPRYEEVDLAAIQEWNNINADDQDNVKAALTNVINKELSINQTYTSFLFASDHNPDNVGNYDDYVKRLNREQPEGWQATLTALNRAFEEYRELYKTWINLRASVFNQLVEAFKEKYNGNLYTGRLYQYKAITSDVEHYAPLIDENGNQTIVSQNILDGMITSLGNIYSKTALSSTYTLLSIGSVYREVADNNLKIEYFHKEYKEAGYISKLLFERLKGIPQQLYCIQNNKYVEVALEDSYDSETHYYQRISSRFKGGPHIDTLHSTDLDYKLHAPRNWKFNVNTDFHFNAAGFNPKRQNYYKDKKNEIYLKKTSSGELYPVHMDNKGYKLLNKLLESGQYSNAKTGEKVQLPEAGFYVSNELKYAQQVDQRTFDINLPEFGNLASKMWDLVYPRGEWIEYHVYNDKGEETYIDYDDEKFLAGELYYPENDDINSGRFIQMGRTDQILRNRQYYIFQPAPDDSVDAPRYVFIGNDRAINQDDYPTTMAGLVRYIYKLLGLKTDNDYRDIPSEETLYGIYNGLLELLGKWTDNYEISRFIPIATKIDNGGELPWRYVVEYGLSGDINFGSINTEDLFLKLHNGAFGPLYIVREGFPIWGDPVDKTKLSDGLQYYKKTDKGYEKIEGTEGPEVEFYTPSLLYEKATYYDAKIQYYRDMNSLWGLLREFQRCRDGYQADWTQDHPGSPAHIQHRPGVIFSDLNYADKYAKWNEKVELPYIKLIDVTSQASLDEKIADFNNIGSIYYKDVVEISGENQEVYCKIASGAIYDNTKEYYRLEEPIDVNLDDYSIGARWLGIAVNRSNSGGAINYVPDSGMTDSGQTITLIELTPNKLIELIQQAESSDMPLVPSSVLNDNDWATIRRISDEGTGANYWSVGDTKTIVINGIVGRNYFDNLSIDCFILGFNHNAAKEGNNRIHFGIGKNGDKLVALVDDYNYNKFATDVGWFSMNSSDTNTGGWKDCQLRNVVLQGTGTPTLPTANTMLAALPSDLRAVMKSVTKYTDNAGDTTSFVESNITATADYLFIPAIFEIVTEINSSVMMNIYEGAQQDQYDYFKSGNSITAYKYNDISASARWWSRSPGRSTITDAKGFGIVIPNGYIGAYFANVQLAVLPCFCV